MPVNVKAIVAAGRGKAASLRRIEIAELSEQLGTELISGSLNLIADKPTWLTSKTAIYSTEQGHIYWHATMNGLPVVVNRWKGDCPVHVYEIYANIRLRDAFDLNDGDEVCLSLGRDIIDVEKCSSVKHIVTWYLLWFFREGLYYKSDRYLRWLKKKPLNGYVWRAVQM